jgi:DNA-binding NtrC family response regulator
LRARTPVKALTPEAIQFLADYSWPGNVRELETNLETMLVSAGREVLTLDDVPLDLLVRRIHLAGNKKEAKLFLKRVRRQFERQYIRKVLEKTHGHQIRAAAALGLHRNTLIWKLKKLNLQDDYRLIVRKRREQGLGFRSPSAGP